MKSLSKVLIILMYLCIPATMLAVQNDDDNKYLVGAVPEVDGKVVFSKEFSIPAMEQEEVYKRMHTWLEERMKKNGNNSRIIFDKPEEGQIVASGDEWIVFSSNAISLDRTKILYQITITCLPEKCLMDVSRIRFTYREGKEKYTAEEWITDKYALNKDKTKLIRGLAKWRRKTVDFIDNLTMGAAEALSATKAKKDAEAEKAEESKKGIGNGPIVISQRAEVEVKSPAQTVEVRAAKSDNSDGVAASASTIYKEIEPSQLPTSSIQMGAGRLVVVIGTDEFNMTMMTANAGGSLGKLQGKPVIFCFLSPDQPYEQMEKAESYKVRFYPTGEKEPTVVLECKKMPTATPMEGQPRMYAGEIVKAMTK